MAQYALPSATHYAPVLDLRPVRIRVHLRKAQLRLSASSLGEGEVSDDVSQGLSVGDISVSCCSAIQLSGALAGIAWLPSYLSGSAFANTFRFV